MSGVEPAERAARRHPSDALYLVLCKHSGNYSGALFLDCLAQDALVFVRTSRRCDAARLRLSHVHHALLRRCIRASR